MPRPDRGVGTRGPRGDLLARVLSAGARARPGVRQSRVDDGGGRAGGGSARLGRARARARRAPRGRGDRRPCARHAREPRERSGARPEPRAGAARGTGGAGRPRVPDPRRRVGRLPGRRARKAVHRARNRLLQRARAGALPRLPARVPCAARAERRALGGGGRLGGVRAPDPENVDVPAHRRARGARAGQSETRRPRGGAAARGGMGIGGADRRAAAPRAGGGGTGGGGMASRGHRGGRRGDLRRARPRGRAPVTVARGRARRLAQPRRARDRDPVACRPAVGPAAGGRVAGRRRRLGSDRLSLRSRARARRARRGGRGSHCARDAHPARGGAGGGARRRASCASAASGGSRAGPVRRRGTTRRD